MNNLNKTKRKPSEAHRLAKLALDNYGIKISEQTLIARLSRGWSKERTISTPVQRLHKQTPERLRQQRYAARKRYAKSHPEKIRSLEHLSYARYYIRHIQDLAELQEVKRQLKEKRIQLEGKDQDE